MLPLASTTILPPWVVLPAAVLTLLVVATHALAVHSSDLPVRKRRIRVVNGVLMLFVTALLAYALGLARVVDQPTSDPAGTRQFVLIWLTIIGLLGIVMALAGADAAHSVAGAMLVRRRLRRELRERLGEDLGKRRLAQRRAVSPAPAPTRDRPRAG